MGKRVTIWTVSGRCLYPTIRHFQPHAPQAISQEGAGFCTIILVDEVKAKEVGDLFCAVVGDEDLGEAKDVVGVGDGGGCGSGVVYLSEAVVHAVVGEVGLRFPTGNVQGVGNHQIPLVVAVI